MKTTFPWSLISLPLGPLKGLKWVLGINLHNLRYRSRPVSNDHVGTLDVGSWKLPGRSDVGHAFFYPLVQGAVAPDAPIGVTPALACVNIDEL